MHPSSRDSTGIYIIGQVRKHCVLIGATRTGMYKDPDLSGSKSKSWQEAQIKVISRRIMISVTTEFSNNKVVTPLYFEKVPH